MRHTRSWEKRSWATARLLDELGLLPYILEQPHLTLTSGQFLVRGVPAAEFRFERISPEYPYAIWMPQPVFFRVHRHAARAGCFE